MAPRREIAVALLSGPPKETYKLEVEIDATDQLEFPRQNRTTVEHGIYPQLAALKMLVYPPSERLQENARLAAAGMLENVPLEPPLTLFVWSKNRVLPIRLTKFSITRAKTGYSDSSVTSARLWCLRVESLSLCKPVPWLINLPAASRTGARR